MFGCPNFLYHKLSLVVVLTDIFVTRSQLLASGSSAQAAKQTSFSSISEMKLIAIGFIAIRYRLTSLACAVARNLCHCLIPRTSSLFSSVVDTYIHLLISLSSLSSYEEHLSIHFFLTHEGGFLEQNYCCSAPPKFGISASGHCNKFDNVAMMSARSGN